MKVTIITTQGSKTEITSSATTWGQLRQELSRYQIQTDGMKAVLGSTRTTLELDNSILPHEDFKIFLYPNKVKSGNDQNDQVLAKELERVKGKVIELVKDVVREVNVIQDSLIGKENINKVTTNHIVKVNRKISSPESKKISKRLNRDESVISPTSVSSGLTNSIASDDEMNELASIMGSEE